MMNRFGNNVQAIAHERAIAKLHYVGEEFITVARSGGSYKDRSGNLRSSTGYIVLHDGKIVDEFFEVHNGKGADGVKQAKKLVRELRGKYSEGYVLICMAGMEYATYVELNGYDVLSGGEIAARKMWKKMFTK